MYGSVNRLTTLFICVIVGLFIFTFNSQGQWLPQKNVPDMSLAPPPFSPEIFIQANHVDLRADTYAAVPCVVDWNTDGNKDLLVGCFYYGNVYLYLNSGTNATPSFTTGNKLKANNLDISVTYG